MTAPTTQASPSQELPREGDAYAHASGQHDGECQACLDEAAMGTGYPICAEAAPAGVTGEEAGWCGWCGHSVEEVVPTLVA